MTRRLRYRMNVYHETGDDGSEQPSYSLWMQNVPVDIQPVAGGETYRGRQLEATTTHLVSVRFIDGMLPTMKLVDAVSSAEYSIVRIENHDGREHMRDIQCSRVVV